MPGTTRPTPAGFPQDGASKTAGCRAIPKPAATSSRRSSRRPGRSVVPNSSTVRIASSIGNCRFSTRTARFPGTSASLAASPSSSIPGQIMHGMLAGYCQLGRSECLESAVRAGHWLARHQDSDGCWRKYEHNGVPHTYNTRGNMGVARDGAGCRRPGTARARRYAISTGLWRSSKRQGGSPTTPSSRIGSRSRIRSRMRSGGFWNVARCRRANGTSARHSRRHGPWQRSSAPTAGSPGPMPTTGFPARATAA